MPVGGLLLHKFCSAKAFQNLLCSTPSRRCMLVPLGSFPEMYLPFKKIPLILIIEKTGLKPKCFSGSVSCFCNFGTASHGCTPGQTSDLHLALRYSLVYVERKSKTWSNESHLAFPQVSNLEDKGSETSACTRMVWICSNADPQCEAPAQLSDVSACH